MTESATPASRQRPIPGARRPKRDCEPPISKDLQRAHGAPPPTWRSAEPRPPAHLSDPVASWCTSPGPAVRGAGGMTPRAPAKGAARRLANSSTGSRAARRDARAARPRQGGGPDRATSRPTGVRRILDPFDTMRANRVLAPHDPKLNDIRWLIGESLRSTHQRARLDACAPSPPTGSARPASAPAPACRSRRRRSTRATRCARRKTGSAPPPGRL